MLISAADHLATHADYLNRINVYPVADQDTGTNMTYTTRYIKQVLQSQKYLARHPLLHDVARAALIGSRGNSGTVLSQRIGGRVDSIAAQLGTNDGEVSIQILHLAAQ